jgi:hypothetical protein
MPQIIEVPNQNQLIAGKLVEEILTIQVDIPQQTHQGFFCGKQVISINTVPYSIILYFSALKHFQKTNQKTYEFVCEETT